MKHAFDLQLLYAWAAIKGRHFPWRQTTQAFHLAMAEILLQRTQAAAIEETWYQLIAWFPTPVSLWEAPDYRVYELVRHLGLGSQRTVRLKAIAANWQSFVESEKKIPGLGDYGTTIVRLKAGLQERHVPIDGNIARILVRYYGFQFKKGEARKKPHLKNAMRQLLTQARSSSCKLKLLYSLVDLGALLCKPINPSCSECPLRSGCSVGMHSGSLVLTKALTENASARAKGGGTASEIC